MDVDVLPPAEDVFYVAHGTSLQSAESISRNGLCRGDRLHIHFYACNRNGNIRGNQRVRLGSQSIVIAASNAARDAGIVFYGSSNDVISPDGIDGVIPPRLIRAVRLLPTYDLLWTNEDRVWKVNHPVINGNPFDHSDSERETHAITASAPSDMVEIEPSFDEGWESESEPNNTSTILHHRANDPGRSSGQQNMRPMWNRVESPSDVITRTCHGTMESAKQAATSDDDQGWCVSG